MLINFQPKFEPLILAGSKTHTMRPDRKDNRRAKIGEVLYLYVYARTKRARKIAEKNCTATHRVILDFADISQPILFDTFPLRWTEREQFARRDGFASFEEMRAFFENQYGRTVLELNLYSWAVNARPFDP